MASGIAGAAGANAGTSAPAPLLKAYSSDDRGSVTFGTGTAPAAGAQLTLTLGSTVASYADTSGAAAAFLVTPTNAATAALGPWWASIDSTGRVVTIGCVGTPAASQANTVYGLAYALVI